MPTLPVLKKKIAPVPVPSQTRTSPVTVEEYRKTEERSEERHDYEQGVLIPMAGGTLQHSVIKGNIYVLLATGIGDHPFVVCNSDVRVRIPDAMSYTYPDISVVAGTPVLDPEWETATLMNPCLIVEVLSKSTEKRDRGKKFDGYRRVPTLREYILVDQYRVGVQQWVRSSEQEWCCTEYTNLDDLVELVSVPVRLPLHMIYRRVTLPETRPL